MPLISLAGLDHTSSLNQLLLPVIGLSPHLGAWGGGGGGGGSAFSQVQKLPGAGGYLSNFRVLSEKEEEWVLKDQNRQETNDY